VRSGIDLGISALHPAIDDLGLGSLSRNTIGSSLVGDLLHFGLVSGELQHGLGIGGIIFGGRVGGGSGRLAGCATSGGSLDKAFGDGRLSATRCLSISFAYEDGVIFAYLGVLPV
jgi:hypothetical protein